MKKDELLNLAKKVRYQDLDKLPAFNCIYIIPQRKLHDSGYRMMYVIGERELNYFLLDDFSDVINIGDICSEKSFKDINMDITKNGIIRLWSRRFYLKCTTAVSNCIFDIEDVKK